MKVNADELRQAFKSVDRVPQQATLLASQYVKAVAEKKRLSLYLGGIVSARASVPCDEDKTFYVERKILSSFLANASDEVTITAMDSKVTLKSGRSKIEAAQPEPSQYSIWVPKKDAVEVDIDPAVIKFIATFTSTNPGDEHLEAAQLIKGFGVVASDSFSVAACLDKRVSVDGALPRLLTRCVGQNDEEKLLMELGGAGLRGKSGWLYQPLTVADKPFPLKPVQEMIKKALAQQPVMMVKGVALSDGIRYLQSFAYGGGNFEVQCLPAKNGVSLLMETPTAKADCIVEASKVKLPKEAMWPLTPVAVWVDKMKEYDLTIGTWDDTYFSFVAKAEEQTHVLIVVRRQ